MYFLLNAFYRNYFNDIDTRNAYNHSSVTTYYTMAETNILVEHLTRLNELKNKNIKERIKDFGPIFDAIVKSLNISVSKELESLMVSNKFVEMGRSPMKNLDRFIFLPPLWSHEDNLRPLILHSGGRKTGNLFVQLHTVDDCEWYTDKKMIPIIQIEIKTILKVYNVF